MPMGPAPHGAQRQGTATRRGRDFTSTLPYHLTASALNGDPAPPRKLSGRRGQKKSNCPSRAQSRTRPSGYHNSPIVMPQGGSGGHDGKCLGPQHAARSPVRDCRNSSKAWRQENSQRTRLRCHLGHALMGHQPIAVAALHDLRRRREHMCHRRACPLYVLPWASGDCGADRSDQSRSNCQVHTGGASFPETPFGGIKNSGYGREGGVEGTRDFMTTVFVSTQN